ncbi:MAG: hypothetical protein WA051_00920 [Minisyncoccia bacterium]
MRGTKDRVVDGYKVREVFGRIFVFHDELKFWYNPAGGRAVQVHQGSTADGEHWDPHTWYVVVPDTREFVQLKGEDAEDRAFSVAVGYITQTK